MTETSWGGVAGWYDDLLGQEGTYQSAVVLPHLLRLLGPMGQQRILDIGCGQGFFAEAFARGGATEVLGVDVGMELLAIAEARTRDVQSLSWRTASAEALGDIARGQWTTGTCVLALQNMADPIAVCREMFRALAPGGTFHLVLNHPAFRVPQKSSWGWDDVTGVQYRRVDAYMTDRTVRMRMHPGADPSVATVSFHHPLAFFVKALVRSGFVVSGMEEWVSHKTSDSGPRAAAENVSRKEIPLFLYLQAVKYEGA